MNSLTLGPASVSELSQGGFSLKPQRATIFTHASYPGWLFKKVDSLGEALSCGGIMCFTGSTHRVAYFGRTFLNMMERGELGRFAIMSSVTMSGGARRRTFQQDAGSDSSQYEAYSAMSNPILTQLEEGASMKYVAVISQASSGFLVENDDTGKDYKVYGGPALHGANAQGLTRLGLPREGADGVMVIPSNYAEGIQTTAVLPSVSGFITYDWTVGKAAWLRTARSGFLSMIEDPDVRQRYAGAYDEEIVNVGDGNVTDGVRFVFGRVDGVVKLAAGVRASSHTFPVATNSGHLAYIRVLKTNSPPFASDGIDPVTNVPYRFLFPHECEIATGDLAGVPMPAVHFKNGVRGAGSTGAEGVDGPWFSASEVPYKSIRIVGETLIPMSSVFASMFPGSHPAGPVEGLATLDISDRVNKEVEAITALDGQIDAEALLVPGQESAASSVVTENLAKLEENDGALERMLSWLTPFARFAVGTVVNIDRRVRNSL